MLSDEDFITQSAVAEGQALAAQLRAEGLEEDALEVERLTRICEDVLAGKVKGAELDQAIEDCKVEIAKLRAAGKEDEAVKLEHMLEKMEAARRAELEAEALEREKELLIAEEAAVEAEKEADSLAAKVEADLIAAGLGDEAAEIHRLREALESGDMSGAELEQAAKDAHALAAKLKDMGRWSCLRRWRSWQGSWRWQRG